MNEEEARENLRRIAAQLTEDALDEKVSPREALERAEAELLNANATG
jgi:hypothetical protein